ncbi:MAG: hypothetical protein C0457_21075 [Polymorphum sp.]|uniref:Uncharacterized protein n=2 Tax=Stappiaceae TaxID=2821832 RepID=A0A0U3PNK2_9HYPH|nr:hypothetical protein [Pannonibacter phragmitetus]ALV25684.1 hypothetical protein APZ00_00175 [Pannonibacter phragmitetus]MBA4207491.1 hypothetical protein [Polymorphum sp.]
MDIGETGMVRLRKRLETLDDFFAAVEGYTHLPTELLVRFLLDNYLVDLDQLSEFANAMKLQQVNHAAASSAAASIAA